MIKKQRIKTHKDACTAIVLDSIEKNKQTIIFCASKRSAESQAEKISKEIKTKSKQLEELKEKILKTLSKPTKQCERLAKCIEKGIAFHHAGLHKDQRELIEKNFREGIISTISATPTLAIGMDLPAFRTIIRDTKRFGERGMKDIQVLEYEQMAGRAGRPGKEKFGEAILIAKTEEEKEELQNKYVKGKVENIYSKLAVEPVLRTYILSLVSSKMIEDTETLQKFFDKTFYAKQYKDLNRLHQIIERMTKALKEWNFIEYKEEKENKEEKNTDFTNALEMIKQTKEKKKKLKATNLGIRISELYLDPFTAKIIIDKIKNIKKNIDINLIHLLTTSLELRPLLRSGVKDRKNNAYFLNEEELNIDEEELSEYSSESYEDTIKTSNFFKDWINEYDEEKLLEKYNIRPGEINAKIQRMDWLLYATEELALKTQQKEIIKHIKNLRIRIKNGIKKELVPLMNFKGIGRVRARKLYNNKIRGVNDIKKISAQTLAQIIGNKITRELKEQVGEPITDELKPQTKKIAKKNRKQTLINEF